MAKPKASQTHYSDAAQKAELRTLAAVYAFVVRRHEERQTAKALSDVHASCKSRAREEVNGEPTQ